MVGGRVLGDRILIGVGISEFALERLLLVADDLGLLQDGRAELAPHESLANAVLFGVASEKDGAVCKVYQEFWDHVLALNEALKYSIIGDAVNLGARVEQLNKKLELPDAQRRAAVPRGEHSEERKLDRLNVSPSRTHPRQLIWSVLSASTTQHQNADDNHPSIVITATEERK